MPSVVERAFWHVGVILTVGVSLEYDCMNGDNFGANPHLSSHFIFRHDLGNISSNRYSPFALANLAQFCPDSLRHSHKLKFSNHFNSFESFVIDLCCDVQVFP